MNLNAREDQGGFKGNVCPRSRFNASAKGGAALGRKPKVYLPLDDSATYHRILELKHDSMLNQCSAIKATLSQQVFT